MKDIDPFHPSFRVKRVNKLPISRMLEDTEYKDLFLDILQNEKSGLIKYEFEFDPESLGGYLQNLGELYTPIEYQDNLKKIYSNLFKILFSDVLIPEIKKEIHDELKLNAENYVVEKC